MLEFDFLYEYEKDKRTGPYLNTVDNTTTFSEKLGIETWGWLYHPALLIYTLRLEPEWEQITEHREGRDKKSSRTFLEGYSTELTFLQYKPYSLTIFGDKYMSTIRHSFAGRSKKDSDTYGARLMLTYSFLPTQLNYTHVESTQTGFFTTDYNKDEL
ncbi:hypothetical protein HZA26_03185, partial [Candidatus Nomurabacteria bacterium]|nr:hypothetical protein [Candidatus Nomurabacteria bacterium]